MLKFDHFFSTTQRFRLAGPALTGLLGVLGASAPLAAREVDPATLSSPLRFVSSQGSLCPPGSISVATSTDVASVILSRSASGRTIGTCTLTFDADVPAGFTMGTPRVILRGFASANVQLSRSYRYDRAVGAAFFSGLVNQDFVLADDSLATLAPSCGRSRRVRFNVDVSAALFQRDTFFQLDAVDVDTNFRFGTDYRFCDPRERLQIKPGQSGDFCDGPNRRACAAGLVCEHDPNSDEGQCTAP